MKQKADRMTRISVALLSGGLLLGSGSCIPSNFWIDTWGATLSSAADRAITTFVLDPIFATAGQTEDE